MPISLATLSKQKFKPTIRSNFIIRECKPVTSFAFVGYAFTARDYGTMEVSVDLT
jgi:hypothetical protein